MRPELHVYDTQKWSIINIYAYLKILIWSSYIYKRELQFEIYTSYVLVSSYATILLHNTKKLHKLNLQR